MSNLKKIEVIQCAILLVLLFLILPWIWIGFLGSDDATYVEGAYGWLLNFPYVGDFGTIRYPLTLPIALSYTIFGESAFSSTLPNLVLFFAIVFGTYFVLRRHVGTNTAFGTCLILVTLPIFVVNATVTFADITELTFILVSLYLFYLATTEERPMVLLLAAGASAGVAFLTRETTVFLIAFYGLIFLAGYGISRIRYFQMAAGFLMVWGLEVVYLTVMTGDPLYRVQMSMHHDSTIDRSVEAAGNIGVSPIWDPLFVLLVNQEFGIHFWVLLGVCVWTFFVWRRGETTFLANPFIKLIAAFGAFWFVCVAAATTLLPLNPRYFMATAFCGAIVIAYSLSLQWDLRRKALVVSTSVLLGLANLAGLVAENTNYMFGEHQYVALLKESQGVLITDKETLRRAKYLMTWSKIDSDLATDVLTDEAPVFINGNRFGGINSVAKFETLIAKLSDNGCEVVERFGARPQMESRLMKALGLNGLIPPSIWFKLSEGHPGAIVVSPKDSRCYVLFSTDQFGPGRI